MPLATDAPLPTSQPSAPGARSRLEAVRTALRWLLGLLLVAAGINHFLSADLYVAIMPPYLPWPLALVYVSGAAEVAIGLLLLPARTRRLGGWLAFGLFAAVFPANLHMALHPDLYPDLAPAALWARLPLQAVFFLWAWWVCFRGPPLQSSSQGETRRRSAR